MHSPLKEKADRRIKSFGFAFAGWAYVLRTQPNSWVHAAFSLAVLAVGLWLGLPRQDWAILIVTIVIVWVAEFTNTAVEAVVDMTMPSPHPLARVAKDVAAAAVLIAAAGSVVVGLLVLGPPLWQRLVGA
jgi:diacylglycerol kinase